MSACVVSSPPWWRDSAYKVDENPQVQFFCFHKRVRGTCGRVVDDGRLRGQVSLRQRKPLSTGGSRTRSPRHRATPAQAGGSSTSKPTRELFATGEPVHIKRTTGLPISWGGCLVTSLFYSFPVRWTNAHQSLALPGWPLGLEWLGRLLAAELPDDCGKAWVKWDRSDDLDGE